jgi:nucleoside-diphosphate-sugar epimerase
MRLRRQAPPVVAVTGAASGLGRLLVERLAARDDLDGLIGLDTTAARVDGVVWRAVEVRDPLLASRLSGVTTVVHLATTYDVTTDPDARRAHNVRGTELLLAAARTAGVKRVVLTTSAAVYGPRPGDPVPLPEDAPLLALPDDSLVGDHVEVERLAAVRGGPEVTVLRPATLVGGRLGQEYDGTLLRQLSSSRLLAVRGTEPLWQLCHVDDLVAALELAACGVVTGGVTVGCDGWLAQSEVESIAGVRRLELPASVAISTAERLHRLGVSAGSPRELDHLLAPLVVPSTALKAVGWEPQWTNDTALRGHLAGRAAEGRGGAYTAAGATVALVGTAALVRAARRRRRGH